MNDLPDWDAGTEARYEEHVANQRAIADEEALAELHAYGDPGDECDHPACR